MKAALTYHQLHTITRAFATAIGSGRHHRHQLELRVAGEQVSFAARRGGLAGQVTTSGGLADGQASVELAELTGALAAVAATGRGKATTIVALSTGPGLLQLAAASTATIPAADVPADAPPAGGGTLIVTVPAAAWRDAVTTVAAAAATKANDPPGLRDIRLWRDPGSCLVLEATDRQRLHRVVVGDPGGDRFEARLGAANARAALRLIAMADDDATTQLRYTGDHLTWDAVWDTGAVSVCLPAADHGWWPETERLLETLAEADLRFTVDPAAMRDALRRAAAITTVTTPPLVDIDPGAGCLRLTVAGPAGPPARLRIEVPITGHGPVLRTRVVAEHAHDLFTAAAADGGPVSVRVNTSTNLMGLTHGPFHGVTVHMRQSVAG